MISALFSFSTLVLSANPCDIPRVMIVLDRSSSMVTGNTPDGDTKWEAATAAVSDLVTSYAGRIDFGLTVFPSPNACAPGAVVVPVGSDNGTLVEAALATPPPDSGNYTPMAETLAALAGGDLSWSTGLPSYVLLVTDGWQYCVPYSASTRFLSVGAVEDLAAAGLSTFILGLGAEVDALNNNRMAVAGGTDLPGCDPTGTDATAADLCYHQTSSGTGIAAAFEEIARTIVDETCDGLDNDCDGNVDNRAPGLPALLSVACASPCGAGESTCTEGAFGVCEVSVACNDADPCTQQDWCDGEVCSGEPIVCDDGDPCTADACVTGSGCAFTPIAGCGEPTGPTGPTGGGVETPNCPGGCDDNNPCTEDRCELSGCVHAGVDAQCDDGNPCTAGDVCLDGACSAGPNLCDGGPGVGPGHGGGVDAGCGCRQGGSDVGLWAALGLLGLVGRRVRRRIL